MTKKTVEYPDLEKSVSKMLKEADTFDQRKQAIETALKFEALKLKAKGNDYGKGFDQADDDEGQF